MPDLYRQYRRLYLSRGREINNPAQRMALRESIKTIATRLGVGYKVYEKETQIGHFRAHIRDNVYVEEEECREVSRDSRESREAGGSRVWTDGCMCVSVCAYARARVWMYCPCPMRTLFLTAIKHCHFPSSSSRPFLPRPFCYHHHIQVPHPPVPPHGPPQELAPAPVRVQAAAQERPPRVQLLRPRTRRSQGAKLVRNDAPRDGVQKGSLNDV
jgi:hypothetical protein